MKKVITALSNNKVQIGLLFFITLFITIQRYFLVNNNHEITPFNNYIIFKQSYFHFMEGKDLYQHYRFEYYDLFKYSPTFAMCMAVLAYLPDVLGLFVWNFINVFVLYYSFSKLPFTSKKAMIYAGLFILVEVITTTQNSQSNALLTGMIILAYVALQNKKVGQAALLIVSTIFIKLFGIVALVMFLFYPNKVKSALYVFLWTVIIGVFPLLIISMDELIMMYKSWVDLLRNDHSVELKFSVMGFLHTWFGVPVEVKGKALIVGALVFCVPLVRIKLFSNERYRLLFLSSVLLWVVLFNHMAESATFIIAVSGIAIWFFTKKDKSMLDKVLLALTILFTLLSPTDIYPAFIRYNYFMPYVVKVVPCILVWIKINYELLTIKSKNRAIV